MSAQTEPINGSEPGNVEMVVAAEHGKVVLRFARPMLYVLFEPENCRLIANAMSRAAYEAHYGMPPPDDLTGTLAQEMRERATEQLRQRMINRVVLMLSSMERARRTPAHVATNLVDAMLREMT